jgi:DNA processing protein
MDEEEVRRRRLEEALARCLDDPVLCRSHARIERRSWIRGHADRLMRLGARAALPGEDDFPSLLIGIPDEPTHLFYRGTIPARDQFTVAIIGTRLPTPTGRRFADEAARRLAATGAAVVSGLARGIDAVAHGAALEGAGGGEAPARAGSGAPPGRFELAAAPVSAPPPTVAILACGLDYCYPPENARLMERIAARGAVVSEFPPGARPLKHHFIRRNRLLSGMSRLVVVVEARARSGALVTAQYGVDQGRDVAAVPGDVYSPPSAGPNRLISEGACPVVSIDALTELCESLGLARPKRGKASQALRLDFGDLSDDVSRVFENLGSRPRSPDFLAGELGWPASRIWAALLELELRSAVRRHPGGYVRWK